AKHGVDRERLAHGAIFAPCAGTVEGRSHHTEHLYQYPFEPAIFRAMTDDPLSLLAAGASDLAELAVEGSLRPRTLDEYIGQREVKASLDVLLQAAKQRGEAGDPVPLPRPPGPGEARLR